MISLSLSISLSLYIYIYVIYVYIYISERERGRYRSPRRSSHCSALAPDGLPEGATEGPATAAAARGWTHQVSPN